MISAKAFGQLSPAPPPRVWDDLAVAAGAFPDCGVTFEAD